MLNRRVFQRNSCEIPVMVHSGGKFVYGEITDLSLGGAKLRLKAPIDGAQLELSPKKVMPDGIAIIPLPYNILWQREGKKSWDLGLKFSGGTDAFFRGWLSEHIQHESGDVHSLLDHRKLVRIPCQIGAQVSWDEEIAMCAALDISAGGLSFITDQELFPGMSVSVLLEEKYQFGKLELFLLRVLPLTGHFLCSGKFLELTAGQKKDLDRLISSLVGQNEQNSSPHS